VRFYDHHATHAMAAAWYSGFDECAVLTIDGVGELNVFHTASTWSAGRLTRLGHSDSLGLRPGNTMKPSRRPWGSSRCATKARYSGSPRTERAQKLYKEFHRALRASPRGNYAGNSFDSDFVGRDDAYKAREAYLEALVRANPREDAAAAAQAVFEDAIEEVARDLLARTGQRGWPSTAAFSPT
jgi:predicted NodU family carbamoyl transferase